MKILIVDDSKLHREYLVRFLTEEGHQCIIAANGQAALTQYKEQTPDLIILDVILPDIQGHEVAEQIRILDKNSTAEQDLNWTPIIFLSGMTDESYLEKCILSGGDDYLHKPTNKVILKAKIYAMERLLTLQKQVISQNNEIKQKEKMESLQKFSFGVAHEIRNPLASIVHSSQNLIRRLKPNLTKNKTTATELGIDIEKMQQYIQEREIVNFAENILTSSKQVTKIIEALLKITEYSEAPRKNAKIINLIQEAVKLAKNSNISFHMPFEKTNLTIDCSPNLPEICCCDKEIELVLYSILLNSAYALANIPRTPSITISISLINAKLNINIIDNGCGIPKNIMNRVFDPFFTTKDIEQGLGLGLTVAYNIIVNKYCGSMAISSKENEGSTVTIQLPIAPINAPLL